MYINSLIGESDNVAGIFIRGSKADYNKDGTVGDNLIIRDSK